MKYYREDPELMQVLQNASQEDLAVLVDFITCNGEGRISLDSGVKDMLVAAKQQTSISGDVLLYIAEEIQKYGANTLITLFRGGKGVFYKEIVCDVAKHLGTNYNTEQNVATIESAIQLKVLEKAMEKMSEEEKTDFYARFGISYTTGLGPVAMAALIVAIRGGGFFAYQLALIAANGVAKFVLGRGLALGANAALTRTIAAVSGPIGWALTAIWTVFDVASPAYRVTMPCVVHIGYMRQKTMMRECPNCRTQVAKDAKFCNDCGHKL